MTKYLKSAVLVSAVLFFSLTNGCDAFESFPINIPFTIDVFATGNDNGASGTGAGCLETGSETYQDYKDKIKSLTFVEAAYRTDSVKINGQSTNNLTCDINITVRILGGAQLFSYTVTGVNPSIYILKPLVLQLKDFELDAVRIYLESFQDQNICFDATYSLSNISGGGTPPNVYSVKGFVDFVLEAETEL